MLQQVIQVLGLVADCNLDIMKNDQTLFSITTDILCTTGKVISQINPDIVLVHGDTTTAMVSAMAVFYNKVGCWSCGSGTSYK